MKTCSANKCNEGAVLDFAGIKLCAIHYHIAQELMILERSTNVLPNGRQ